MTCPDAVRHRQLVMVQCALSTKASSGSCPALSRKDRRESYVTNAPVIRFEFRYAGFTVKSSHPDKTQEGILKLVDDRASKCSPDSSWTNNVRCISFTDHGAGQTETVYEYRFTADRPEHFSLGIRCFVGCSAKDYRRTDLSYVVSEGCNPLFFGIRTTVPTTAPTTAPTTPTTISSSGGGGTAAKGTTPKGTAAKGTTPKGTAAKGTTPKGTAAKGTTPKGTAAKGTTPKGTAAKGTTPKGTAAKGTTPKGTAAKGTTPKGTTVGDTEDHDEDYKYDEYEKEKEMKEKVDKHGHESTDIDPYDYYNQNLDDVEKPPTTTSVYDYADAFQKKLHSRAGLFAGIAMAILITLVICFYLLHKWRRKKADKGASVEGVGGVKEGGDKEISGQVGGSKSGIDTSKGEVEGGGSSGEEGGSGGEIKAEEQKQEETSSAEKDSHEDAEETQDANQTRTGSKVDLAHRNVEEAQGAATTRVESKAEGAVETQASSKEALEDLAQAEDGD